MPEVKWSHDILLSKNQDGFIVTDYSAHFVGKVDFKGEMTWRKNDFGPVAKLSTIETKTESGAHSNSFGGDYLVVRNSTPYGVFEIKDEDGSVVESIPRGRRSLNSFWRYAPHSAFSTGELGDYVSVRRDPKTRDATGITNFNLTDFFYKERKDATRSFRLEQ